MMPNEVLAQFAHEFVIIIKEKLKSAISDYDIDKKDDFMKI